MFPHGMGLGKHMSTLWTGNLTDAVMHRTNVSLEHSNLPKLPATLRTSMRPHWLMHSLDVVVEVSCKLFQCWQLILKPDQSQSRGQQEKVIRGFFSSFSANKYMQIQLGSSTKIKNQKWITKQIEGPLNLDFRSRVIKVSLTRLFIKMEGGIKLLGRYQLMSCFKKCTAQHNIFIYLHIIGPEYNLNLMLSGPIQHFPCQGAGNFPIEYFF